MQVYKYNSVTKSFSPAYTKDQFIKKCTQFSEETVHNLLRIIIRPNNISRNHWITECLPWIEFELVTRLSVKQRPIFPIFNMVLNNGVTSDKNISWCDPSIENLANIIIVKEKMYGPAENDSKIAVPKLKQFYDMMCLQSLLGVTDLKQIKELFTSWYNDLPNVKTLLYEDDIDYGKLIL